MKSWRLPRISSVSMIKVITVGKRHESWVSEGIERYQKRLRAPWNLEWVLLPHSSLDGLRARQDESERILSKLNASDYVILLDERGKLLDSPALAQLLQQQIDSSTNIVVIIGGAYGVSSDLQQRADVIWSLSPAVFPHQLVRLIFIEQLYRSQEISAGRPYHHQ